MGRVHMTRAALLIGASALLLISAASVSGGIQRDGVISRLPVPPEESPVRCNNSDRPDDYSSAAVSSVNAPPAKVPRGAPVNTYDVAPPPPPVSMPMVVPAQPAPAAPTTNSVYAEKLPYGSPGNTERYDGKPVASIQSVATAPVSTFSVDVDTGAYANVRRFLNQGNLPPADAVRTEEMINYFRYDYPRPDSSAEPFSVTTDVATTPWNPETRLLRIGLRGYDVATDERPRANLVFLVDVSGSMDEPDKLPLVKAALQRLADRLRPDDRVSIVVYAGNAGLVLAPTANKTYVKAALDCLQAGGSTAGGEGIKLAYDTARSTFVKGGINRIFLATDGDFNVGVSDTKALEALVKSNRDDGITLTTLGFGDGNYNDAMMEHIADVGNGNYAYIDSDREAEKVLDDELSATMVTIAKDVKVQVEFNPAAIKQYRLIGYENRALAEEDFNNDAVDAGDMGAGHQVTALYEVVPAAGAGWLSDRRYPANTAAGVAPAGTANELCFVKLRYKLPEGGASRLISRPVPAAMLRDATAPSGDMAFVTAVAAFGQKLRGDKYLGKYSFADIQRLAGSPQGPWRQEFVRLTDMAGNRKPSGG
jgi:Ca-activated chloride channel family protein